MTILGKVGTSVGSNIHVYVLKRKKLMFKKNASRNELILETSRSRGRYNP